MTAVQFHPGVEEVSEVAAAGASPEQAGCRPIAGDPLLAEALDSQSLVLVSGGDIGDVTSAFALPLISAGRCLGFLSGDRRSMVSSDEGEVDALTTVGVVAATNLHRSRLGRAWMAVREDEVAAAATGVNTVAIKLLAFSIGASFSGLAGTFYGAKLSLVSSENFAFVVSVTILIMVVLGGMGNIPGVILGALMIYYVLFNLLTNLPDLAASFASAIGLGFLNASHGDWPGLHDEVQRMNFLIFGLILVLVMLFRPQGLLPSRVREQELAKGVSEQAVFDLREEG